MKHPDDEELSRYVANPAPFDGRETIETHLTECAACRDVVAVSAAFDAALRENEPWLVAREVVANSRSDAAHGLALTVAREDELADRKIAPLLDNPFRFVKANVPEDPAFRTAGGIRVLCRAANVTCDRRPLHALDLADAAVAIAGQLNEASYPPRLLASLRGLAWKERANALRYLSRYGEAFVALDEAERAYSPPDEYEFERAVVDYIRGTVYYGAEHYDEATRLAKRSFSSFLNFDRADRARAALLLSAISMYKLHQYATAKATFDTILADAQAAGDVFMVARVAANLGGCEIPLGLFESAQEHSELALRLYQRLDIRTEPLRVRWNLGRLAAARGDLQDALRRYSDVAAAFHRESLFIEEALVDLDRIEILAAQGRQQEIATVAAALVARFKDAGMLTSALTAIAYLQEIGERGGVTVAHVAHVRHFVERSSKRPELIFAPLPAIELG